MISQRTKHFLMLASLAPFGLFGGLAAEWFHARTKSSTYPGWKYIDNGTPWYIAFLGSVSLIGLIFCLASVVSLLVEWSKRRARHV